MKKRRLFVGSLPLLVAAVFFLSGCESPTEPGPEFTPPPPPPPPETVYPPGIPQNIAVSEADERLTVTWDAVEYADKYMAQHRIHGDDDWSYGTETAHLNLVIDGLENDIEYEIRVRAGNAAGWGDWSDAVTGTPKEPQAAPESPGNVALLDSGIDFLEIGWGIPPGATMYMVRIGASDDVAAAEYWPSPEYEHAAPPVMIVDLEPDTTYHVFVRAGNTVGWSDWVYDSFATAAPPAPDAPASISLDLLPGAGMLSVGWALSEGATMYRIRIGADDDVDEADYWPSTEYDHAAPPVTISGLAPDTTYHVFVKAGNEFGWSDWTGDDIRTDAPPPQPAPPAPDAPASITLGLLPGAGVISVGWTLSEYATMYRIRVGADDDVDEADYWPSLEYDHAAPPVTVSGLTPDTTYHVFVKAGNEFGWSGWSGDSITTELIQLPDTPTAAPSAAIGNRVGFEIGGVADDGDDYGNAFIQQWLDWTNPERIANAPAVLSGVIGLIWSAVPEATHYDVFIAYDDLPIDAAIPGIPAEPSVTTTALAYFHRDAEPGRRYVFWVRAGNEGGSGPIGAAVSTMMSTQMGVQTTASSAGMIERADYPQDPDVTILDEGVVRLNWAPADRAVWYEVYVGRSLAEVRVLAHMIFGNQPEVQGQTWAETHSGQFRGLVPYRRLLPLQNPDGAARPWNARANDGAGAFGLPGEVFRIYGLETTIHGLDPDQEYFFVIRSLNHNGERGYRRLPWFLGAVGAGIRPTLSGSAP